MARITKQQRILALVTSVAARNRIHGDARAAAFKASEDADSGVHCAHVAVYLHDGAHFFGKWASEAEGELVALVKGSK